MTTVLPSFSATGLAPALLAELTTQGITEPFPIQAATLPDSLAGRDVLGRGRTGSGKTLAFGLPLLHRTAGRRARPGRPLALVLVPTRELAQQVTTALAPYARVLGLRVATVVGGLSLGRQADALRAGAEVVVATPGRLHDLINRGDARLDQVAVTVLDEADQMADMGFLPQVTKLLEQVAGDGQRMLFSATLDGGVDKLVRRFLTDPVSHSVDPGTATVTAMTHHVLHVEAEDKPATLTRIAAREGRTILFMGTKHRADRLARQLLAKGVRAAALHGGKSQPQRTRILDQFRTGQVTALVATDVAARGIHVDGLDMVVNVDPPTEAKDYLHRGGRTARAGESGTVVTLVLPEQRREVSRLMATAGIRPQATQVRPGEEAALARVTGAREPSGVPVTVVAPPPQRSAPATSGRGSRSARAAHGAAASGGAPRPAGAQGDTPAGRDAAAGEGRRAGHRASGRSRRPRRPRSA
ncbi:DEAD/DEAH box helicase [Micromonospora carbonacea]|uniref:Superfamily II DNA and RNA helicase n=1 Tax=Micromonospora carbonacea TaxID=47853 RepID=A0A1C4UPI3_9ACTN|nr:DEAD/DEAH box helicase [Micromonospora carbonacea]SCE73554.1 Superfamily II DNA and RNA helicase [Micromonospora carbonacea]